MVGVHFLRGEEGVSKKCTVWKMVDNFGWPLTEIRLLETIPVDCVMLLKYLL